MLTPAQLKHAAACLLCCLAILPLALLALWRPACWLARHAARLWREYRHAAAAAAVLGAACYFHS